MKDIDFVAIGYPSMDTLIDCRGPVSVGRTSIIDRYDDNYYFGGCNVNIACFCAYMGMKPAVMMKVGKNFESSGFKAFLLKSGVDISSVKVIEEDYNSCAYLISNGDGEHVTLFYPGAMDGKYPYEIDEGLIRRAKLGVITVGNCDNNIAFFEKCKKNSVPIVLSMKWDITAFPPECLKDMLRDCSIILMNRYEQEQIMGKFGLHDITECFVSPTVKIIVVTQGRGGSDIYFRDEMAVQKRHIPIADVGTPVDTAGVGDAFIAGFLKAYMNGRNMEECGRLGTITASFVVEKRGCLTNIRHFDAVCARYRQVYGQAY